MAYDTIFAILVLKALTLVYSWRSLFTYSQTLPEGIPCARNSVKKCCGYKTEQDRQEPGFQGS